MALFRRFKPRKVFGYMMPLILGCALLMFLHNGLNSSLATQYIESPKVKNEWDWGLHVKSVLDPSCINIEQEEDNSTGTFHVYHIPAQLRLIVLTHKRYKSLKKLLNSLQGLELDGHNATLEIWIDRNKENSLDGDTYRTARSFCWNRGPVTVHIHSTHAGIYGQWIKTWRPQQGRSRSDEELAIIIEDDIDFSQYAYRWLRKAHIYYGGETDLSGYSLQDENVKFASGNHQGKEIPKEDKGPVYLFKVAGSWGFAPHPQRWIEFQHWFVEKTKDKSFKPYVKAAPLHTSWYRTFEKNNKADTMWTMWFIRFCFEQKLFSLYYNVPHHRNLTDSSLVSNRKEAGLHYFEKKKYLYAIPKLLQKWNPAVEEFPAYEKVRKYDYKGILVPA